MESWWYTPRQQSSPPELLGFRRKEPYGSFSQEPFLLRALESTGGYWIYKLPFYLMALNSGITTYESV